MTLFVERCPLSLSGDGECSLCMELFGSGLYVYSNVMLFMPSERIRAITQEEVEQIKIATCAELFGSELFGQLHIGVRTKFIRMLNIKCAMQ